MRSSFDEIGLRQPQAHGDAAQQQPLVGMDVAVGQRRLELDLKEHPPDVGPAQTLRA